MLEERTENGERRTELMRCSGNQEPFIWILFPLIHLVGKQMQTNTNLTSSTLEDKRKHVTLITPFDAVHTRWSHWTTITIIIMKQGDQTGNIECCKQKWITSASFGILIPSHSFCGGRISGVFFHLHRTNRSLLISESSHYFVFLYP